MDLGLGFHVCVLIVLVASMVPVCSGTVITLPGWGYVVPSGYNDLIHGPPAVFEIREKASAGSGKPAAPVEVFLYSPINLTAWKDRLYLDVECRTGKKGSSGSVVAWSAFLPGIDEPSVDSLSQQERWILVNSTARNSGWTRKRIDITERVKGHSTGYLLIGMTDGYDQNLEQEVVFRNLAIVDADEPIPGESGRIPIIILIVIPALIALAVILGMRKVIGG